MRSFSLAHRLVARWRPIFTRLSVRRLFLVEEALESWRFESGLLAVERHQPHDERWEAGGPLV
jgi:hypothetical protein